MLNLSGLSRTPIWHIQTYTKEGDQRYWQKLLHRSLPELSDVGGQNEIWRCMISRAALWAQPITDTVPSRYSGNESPVSVMLNVLMLNDAICDHGAKSTLVQSMTNLWTNVDLFLILTLTTTFQTNFIWFVKFIIQGNSFDNISIINLSIWFNIYVILTKSISLSIFNKCLSWRFKVNIRFIMFCFIWLHFRLKMSSNVFLETATEVVLKHRYWFVVNCVRQTCLDCRDWVVHWGCLLHQLNWCCIHNRT